MYDASIYDTCVNERGIGFLPCWFVIYIYVGKMSINNKLIQMTVVLTFTNTFQL
mgnify:CR=1 FL=1